MVSIYFAIGIYYVIGAVIYGLYRRGGTGEASRLNGWILYAVSRLTPVFMLEQRSIWVWVNLAFDLVIFLMVHRLSKTEKEGVWGKGCVPYLINPLVLLAILSGQIWMMGMVCLAVPAVIWAVRWAEKRSDEVPVVECYPEYALVQLFALFGWIAVEHYGQSLTWIVRRVGAPPYLLMLTVFGGGIAVVSALMKLTRGGEWPRLFPEIPRCQSAETHLSEGKLTRWDAVIMAALTVTFGLLAYRDLGSLSVPESGYHIQRGENHEIIFDLGKETEVARIDIYLGHQYRREFSFSYIKPGEKQWTLQQKRIPLKTTYAWHKVEMDVTTRYLGVVSIKESAEVLELVILGKDGQVILPQNASEYKELFDEQERYTEYQSYYDRMIFDEVHHARTAHDYLYGPPYSEKTHPPLGKALISIGIELFGMNPFGWRCVCVLFGALMVPLMYLFAWRLFRKTGAAAAATVLLCTEFMHFALSRIATLDIIVAFFLLLMFYLMYCFTDGLARGYRMQRLYLLLVLCGCATGCALAVKWTGGYAAAGIAVAFFSALIPYCTKHRWNGKIRRELPPLFVVCVVSFIVIPCGIYVLSYIPFAKGYPEQSLLQTAIDNSVYMLKYHVDAVFEHTYSSEWYTWLVNYRPVLDAFNRGEGGVVYTISTFGNPLIAWGGLLALVHQFYLWICRGNQNAKFLIIAYLSLLMPWWFIHRTVFIYQYFGCTLILVLMLVHSAMQSKKHQRSALVALSVGSCGLFLLFFPVISGRAVSASYVKDMLQWLSGWRFV